MKNCSKINEEAYRKEQQKFYEAWLKTHHDIEPGDLVQYLNDPTLMIELSATIPIAKIVNSEGELKQLIVRFGSWDRGKKFHNLDITDYFNNVIELAQTDENEDGECVGGVFEEFQKLGKTFEAKVLDYNSFSDPMFAYDECMFYGYTPDDIVVIYEDIKYPSFVRVVMGDDRDRTGKIMIRIFECIPLDELMTGKVILG